MLALLARCARTAARNAASEQVVRCMATAGAAKKASTEIKLVAAKENQVDKVQDELAQLATAFSSTSPELLAWHRLATDPFVPTLVRKAIVNNVLKGKATEITLRLLDSLADENALSAVPSVSKSFDELVLAQKKEVYVTIVTAEPMDKLERQEVHQQASKFVEPGFKLVAQEKVDKKLIGGFVLEFEDRLVDLSTKKKISEFEGFVAQVENDLK